MGQAIYSQKVAIEKVRRNLQIVLAVASGNKFALPSTLDSMLLMIR